MSERFAEHLSRFTPDGAGLDRDALLFAAGRASARPGRRWAALAAALALSQALTLVVLWPAPIVRTPAPVAETPPPTPAPEAPPRDGIPALWALAQHHFGPEGVPPRPQPVVDLMPDPPPLRASLALYDGFTN